MSYPAEEVYLRRVSVPAGVGVSLQRLEDALRLPDRNVGQALVLELPPLRGQTREHGDAAVENLQPQNGHREVNCNLVIERERKQCQRACDGEAKKPAVVMRRGVVKPGSYGS